MKLAILAEALFALSTLLALANPRGILSNVLSSSGLDVLEVLYGASYAAGISATYALVCLIAIAAQVRIAHSWFGRMPPTSAIVQVALGTLMMLSLIVAACWIAWWARGSFWWVQERVPEAAVATAIAALPAAAGAVAAATVAVGASGVRRGAPRPLSVLAFIQIGMLVARAALYWAIREDWLSGELEGGPAGMTAGWLDIADLANTVCAGALAILLLRFSREFDDLGAPPRLGWRTLVLMTMPVALASSLSLAQCMRFAAEGLLHFPWRDRNSWEWRMVQLTALVLVGSSVCWIVPWIYARDRRVWKAMLLGSAATIGVSLVVLLALG